MSSNRLIYDTCAYKRSLDQSVNPLSYVLNPLKYENCNKCRHELGLVGGNNVSSIRGNIVDLENDLRNTTRPYSLCPAKQYNPNNPVVVASPTCGGVAKRVVDTTLEHLPSCQIIKYKPTLLPEAVKQHKCDANGYMNPPDISGYNMGHF